MRYSVRYIPGGGHPTLLAVEGHENKIQANKEVNCVCERSVDVRGELLQKSKPLYAFGMIFFALEKKELVPSLSLLSAISIYI